MKRAVLTALAVAVLGLVILAGLHRLDVQHWLAVHTGTVNEPGGYYGFWSGFGSDVGEVALIGGLITVARAHNCHVHSCWRVGRHQVKGTPYKTCRKHHPSAPDDRRHLTAEHIRAAHDREDPHA